MKRIAFLDYVRVFACFLVMLVHASENFYGAAGSTDMAGPQSFLQNEADRLWVSVYDGFSRMSVPLFMIVSAYLLAPMKKGQSCWQFYRKRFLRIMPPFVFFMVLYSTLPMLWGQMDGEQSLNDLSRIWLNFPALAGHFWFMYPLIGLYLFIPVWGQCFWNEYHMLWYFSGYLGYLVLAHYIRVHLTWGRSLRLRVGFLLMLVGAAATIWSFYVQAVPGVVHSTPVIEVGWAFCTLNCVALTAGTFLLFGCISIPQPPRIIAEMSKLSYGMFLMHIFWLGLWVLVFKSTLGLPTVAAIPVIAVCTFISCFVVTKLISLIPGSKWIIGYAPCVRFPVEGSGAVNCLLLTSL